MYSRATCLASFVIDRIPLPDRIQRACAGSAGESTGIHVRPLHIQCVRSRSRQLAANYMSVNENGGAGKRQNRSAQQKRVGEVAETFDLRRRTRTREPADQNRTVNDQNEKDNPGAEVSGRRARLPS